MAQVKTTKQYKKFKSTEANRQLIPVHVKNLIASIKEHGIIQPLLVTSDMKVIDGQHRLSAAARLITDGHEVSIPYIVTQLDESIVGHINSNSRRWTNDNWFQYHADRGNEACKQLIEIGKSYPYISLTSIATLLNSDARKLHTSDIQSGEFTLDINDMSEYVLRQIRLLSDEYRCFKQLSFISAIRRLYVDKNVDMSRLFSKLRANAAMLNEMTPNTSNAWLITLVRLYNKSLRSKKLNSDNYI